MRQWRTLVFLVALCFGAVVNSSAENDSWRGRLNTELPLLGHRNWIAVVDSAYPLQTSAGIETVDTNADQLEVVRVVLDQVAKAKHVRPVVFTDAEIKLVSDRDAKGVTDYRKLLTNL